MSFQQQVMELYGKQRKTQSDRLGCEGSAVQICPSRPLNRFLGKFVLAMPPGAFWRHVCLQALPRAALKGPAARGSGAWAAGRGVGGRSSRGFGLAGLARR